MSAREQPKNDGVVPLPTRAPARFRLIDDMEIQNLPPLEYIVDDMLPAGGLVVVFAPPESGKSFFTLALAFSLATDQPFFGRKVKQSPVVYVAAEGSSGLPMRVGAWKHSAECYERAGVHFLTEPVQLLEPGDVGAFLATLSALDEPPSLIIFDTLHWCMAGGDENSARDMGMAIQALGLIRRETNATIAVVHHSRLDGDRERGSTSLRGAADTMLSLKREGDYVTVACEKQKDAAHFTPMTLQLIRVEDSCALITATEGLAVSPLFPADPRYKLMESLSASALDDGLGTTAWLKVSGVPARSFYRARKQLVAMGYVEAGKGRGAPNRITPDGAAAL